ncbi:MAG: hypothetical protein ACI8QZ_001005 [Chlamydiales bacterium]|jgi:hypothetical protein
MLSAIVAILLAFALGLARSVHRNRRAIAAGQAGYQPPAGLIRWSDSTGSGSGDEG